MDSAANGRWLDGAIVALLLAATVFLQSGSAFRRDTATDRRTVAVLFAPWITAESAMHRVAGAGARIVGFGALSFIVIAEPDRVGFSDRVSSAGALLTLDAAFFVACFGSVRARS